MKNKKCLIKTFTYEKHIEFRKLWGRSFDDSGDENHEWGGILGIIAIVVGLLAAYKIGFTRGKNYSSGSGGGGEEAVAAL